MNQSEKVLAFKNMNLKNQKKRKDNKVENFSGNGLFVQHIWTEFIWQQPKWYFQTNPFPYLPPTTLHLPKTLQKHKCSFHSI